MTVSIEGSGRSHSERESCEGSSSYNWKCRSWNRGHEVKILKGACCGCHKNNLFVTLGYFLLEGLEKDTGGEARIICRPLGLRRKMVVCLELMLLTVTSSSNSAALYLCLSLCYIQERDYLEICLCFCWNITSYRSCCLTAAFQFHLK
ncbi:uncharacterized protein LOC104905648 [Beta vulgaris subsp. vulgaris]|uniref:uncharacterized protein LOC104905648 n=1 Tax=Beta vulgaris subsp. vulgaris TaxID=3555 RepID=UPI0025477406|nr:uncharacterized protein LOC104905648 [Beta vulgaris subsp. vulgaris]XP_057248785.1 uncharacterized protein LOC104905648 [Beta vulgaris subsp. vulgaris]XP_057248786.1 uncharacterized protein LOC104905648 [Beta vulgaris subsp. vulgaris]